jgi:hypothetical protein
MPRRQALAPQKRSATLRALGLDRLAWPSRRLPCHEWRRPPSRNPLSNTSREAIKKLFVATARALLTNRRPSLPRRTSCLGQKCHKHDCAMHRTTYSAWRSPKAEHRFGSEDAPGSFGHWSPRPLGHRVPFTSIFPTSSKARWRGRDASDLARCRPYATKDAEDLPRRDFRRLIASALPAVFRKSSSGLARSKRGSVHPKLQSPPARFSGSAVRLATGTGLFISPMCSRTSEALSAAVLADCASSS